MTAEHPDHKAKQMFVITLVTFFAVIVLINAVFITAAIHSYPGVVNPNAYEDGVRFNDLLREARERTNNNVDPLIR